MSPIKSLIAASVSVAAIAIAGVAAAGDTSKSAKAAAMMKADVVDTAIAADGFNTLVAAVKAADLVETLKGEGPFTVFAPTDEAFAALPEGTVESLLLPENNAQLPAILTYHVLSGKVMSTDLTSDVTVATVQGEEVSISVADGVSINGASVVSADIEASNGVSHVINQVILPPSASESR
ncbi:MAG: fasciclin domain-containing protein [Sphingomonadales bacterium]